MELLLAAKGLDQSSCVMVITEAWLHPLVSDVAVQLDGQLDSQCFPDLEFLYRLFTSFPDANVSIVLSLAFWLT